MPDFYTKDFPPPPQPLDVQGSLEVQPGVLPTDDATGFSFPDDFFVDDPTGVYYGVGISVSYQWDEGLRYGPVAAPKGSQNAVFWRVHSGVCLKVVNWVMQRFGFAPPVPPSTDTGTDNEVLLSKVISPSQPMDFPDGQQGITVVGQYVYGLQTPPADTDPILIPNSNIRIAALHQLIPADFTGALIGPVDTPAGFSGGPITF